MRYRQKARIVEPDELGQYPPELARLGSPASWGGVMDGGHSPSRHPPGPPRRHGEQFCENPVFVTDAFAIAGRSTCLNSYPRVPTRQTNPCPTGWRCCMRNTSFLYLSQWGRMGDCAVSPVGESRREPKRKHPITMTRDEIRQDLERQLGETRRSATPDNDGSLPV